MPCRYRLKNRCPPFMKSKTRYNFADVCARRHTEGQGPRRRGSMCSAHRQAEHIATGLHECMLTKCTHEKR